MDCLSSGNSNPGTINILNKIKQNEKFNTSIE